MRYARAVGVWLSTVLLYLGVTLLGCGVGDLQRYVASGPRLGYAAVIVTFGAAVGWQALGGLEGIRGGRGEEGKEVGRQTAVRFALSLGLFGALFLLPYADRRGLAVLPDVAALRWLGVLLAALGCAMVFWSGLALGRQYSPEVTIQKDHQLITDGPYRWVRHPRYLGVMALAVGASLVFRSWAGLAACLGLLGLTVQRIADEEALLGREFGAQWEAYGQHSWRLILRVY